MNAPLCHGLPMIRISLPYIFNLATNLEPLNTLPEQDSVAVAEGALKSFLHEGLYAPYLRTSSPLGHTLLGLLQSQTQNDSFDRKLNRYEIWQISSGYSQYRTVLLAELGSLDSYFVTQKGPYDSIALLAFGETLFPVDIAAKVQEAVFDCREAGRCLAYELPTAAGFHAFRATESVLRKYYLHVTGGMAPPKVRSIGVYVKALERAKKGDVRICAALNQLATLHRNPLIHPETVLTTDEAISIIGMARSVVTGMLNVLPIALPTTATAPSAAVPASS